MTFGHNGAPAIDIAVIDDHDVVHAGIQAWCAAADPPIRLTDSFADQNAYRVSQCTVDVVVYDLQIHSKKPDFDSLEAICGDGLPVIVYSHLNEGEVILRCLDLGAASFLVKTEGRHHLIDAIHAAHQNIPYVGPLMANALVNDRRGNRPRLSEREVEVLLAWFRTESKELVGRQLYIAPTTVRTHLQRARAKYAAAGRPAPTKSALLARAIEDGLLSVGDL